MRLIAAGVFVYSALLAGFLLSSWLAPTWGPVASSALSLAIMGAAFVLAMIIFNRGASPFASGPDLAELEEQGLIQEFSFTARRAFEVEETEDEGLHYFIEIEDGRVLCLNGQELYGYSEITDDPDLNQPRTFPCTRFTLRKHKRHGWLLEIKCEGEVLPLDLCARPFTDDGCERYGAHDMVILDESYDALREEMSRGAPLQGRIP